MSDRRDFIRTLGGAAAAYVLHPRAPSPEPRAPLDKLDRIGIQLYSVRSVLRNDFEGTLAKLAEIGYREVEFAGYYERPPAAVRSALQQAGLTAPAAHVSLEQLRSDAERVIAAAQVVGHEFIVVPWIAEAERRTVDGWKKVAGEFNRVGERCRRAGLRFGYHNHDFEFAPVEGKVGYDVLIAETDPTLVQLEIDLYWMTKGGRDPLKYFADHPGRVALVHVKDSAGPPEHRQVDVGAGTIPWARLFARRAQAGIRHFFVEHDEPADPLAFARASFDYLKQLEF